MLLYKEAENWPLQRNCLQSHHEHGHLGSAQLFNKAGIRYYAAQINSAMRTNYSL